MGNWRSVPVPEAYRKAIESDADLPAGKRSLPVTPRQTEAHPVWYLYEHRLTQWPTGLRKAAKVSEERAANVPVRSRKLKFDDILDPYPHVSERHPFFLDYGEGRHPPNHDTTSYNLQPHQNPIKRRDVKFDDILDSDPQVSEKHPFFLDYGEGIHPINTDAAVYQLTSQQIPVVCRKGRWKGEQYQQVTFEHMTDPPAQRSERHPVFLDYGEGLRRQPPTHDQLQAQPIAATATVVRFTLPQEGGEVVFEDDSDGEEEMHQPLVRKIVHFSILRGEKGPLRRNTGQKAILKQFDASKIAVTESEKILHESLVIASHLYWGLVKENVKVQYEDGTERSMNVMELLALPAPREHNPIRYATNREFLVNGCPTFLINTNPHFDFPSTHQTHRNSNANVNNEAAEAVLNAHSAESATDPDLGAEESPATESMHIDIEPHSHLKQAYFPHLTSSVVHHKAPATEHKILLVMQAEGLDEDDIQTYLVEYCGLQKNVRISHVEHHDGITSCRITFPSGKMAKKFKTHMDKIKQTTRCDAKPWEEIVEPDLAQSNLKKRLDRLLHTSLMKLEAHRMKQEEITNRLRNAQGKRSLHEVNELLEERNALQQKWQEFKNQEQEFIQFMKAFNEPFLKVESHWERKATGLEKRFEIETERLEAALPMYAKRSEIVQMIAENQVSILLGETGSGKSTQVTQYLYEAGLAGQKKIVCTQPRKVAATSLAKRVSTEMHSQLGDVVGYKVGMQKQLSKETRILYVTDHMLLKECLLDPLLSSYACVIIDEAHERSLNTDLLLGIIKRALPRRPDLRVIITSATINPAVFVAFFHGCPVLKVSGRVFPVEVIYSDEAADPDANFVQRAVQTALEVALLPEPGDILVFLTTPLETEQACEKMLKMWPNNKNSVMCLALHGKTQGTDQQKVFNPTPDKKHKIVFATNSAETSVTIPGIKVVIDTGLAKEKLYDHKKNMSSLKVTTISQSSANQRKGRAGRTERGKCYRLYREEDYEAMDICSKPEIMKVHLGMALLTLLSFNIEDPLSFDFVEMPPREGLEKAMNVLVYLEAVDQHGKLTPLGRQLAAMSLEPRMAKIVLNGIDRGIGFESILIAGFSTMGGNMFFRGGSQSQKQQADKLKVRFCNPRGDIHTMLDVYREWSAQSEKDKNKWCMDNSINAKSMRMVRDAVREIQSTLSTDLGIKVHQNFHRDHKQMEDIAEIVILESYAMNLCVYAGHESLGYMAATEPDKLVHVHPSSALKSLAKSPTYMVYENTLTTSRAFVIGITCISESSVEEFCEKGMIDVGEVAGRVASPCVISDVGAATAKKILGPKHSTRLALQKELQVHFHTEMLALDVSVEQGTVAVYTLPGLKEECHKLVKRMVVREQQCLYQEEIERPLVEGYATRVIIEHGLQTKCILFADKFRSILIPCVPPQHGAEELVEQLRELAHVTNFEMLRNKAKNTTGLRVTFQNCDAAEEVLQLLKATESGDEVLPGIVAKPDLTGAKGVCGPPVENARCKVTWCRRPNRGLAFVKFDRPYHARCVADSMSHVIVNGSPCPMKLSNKNDEELFVRNISKMLANNDVSKDIRKDIERQTGYKPKDVVVPNEPALQIHESESDCKQYKRYIQAYLEREVPGVTGVEINMIVPKEKAVQYTVFVVLKNWLHIERVKQALQGMTILGKPTQSTMSMKSLMFVRQEIMQYISEELQDVIEDVERIEGVSCHGRALNGGGYRVEISAETAEHLMTARTLLAKCINGTKLDIEKAEHLKYFKHTKKGEKFIATVQRQSRVHIMIDRYQMVFILHGSSKGIKQATQRIMKQVQQLVHSCTREFNLKEQYPPGMSKRLMAQFGLDLEYLERDSGADVLTLQLHNHLLTVHGSNESVQNVQTLLETQALVLTEGRREKTEQSLPDCQVCFCEPDRKEVYRLECCGHVYCESCIKGMLQHAVRDRSFPIQCLNTDCSKDIVMKDVFYLVGTSMERLAPFVAASVHCFMLAHQEEFKYCITPDCEMIYAVNEGDVQMCPLCQVRICTRCNVEYHPGITCEFNKQMKDTLGGRSFDEYSQDTWLAADRLNRALCPKCSTRIEKNGGCMHVHCQVCKIHICWRCKATFMTGGETYAHQSDCLEAAGDE